MAAVKWLPLPGVDSTRAGPPWKSDAIGNRQPQAGPLPGTLVVKNGSKIRSRDLEIPWPSSTTWICTPLWKECERPPTAAGPASIALVQHDLVGPGCKARHELEVSSTPQSASDDTTMNWIPSFEVDLLEVEADEIPQARDDPSGSLQATPGPVAPVRFSRTNPGRSGASPVEVGKSSQSRPARLISSLGRT